MGTIRFDYDAVNDIHLAYPIWTIESEQDCREWYEQYRAYFEPLGRHVDVIFILNEFHIGRGMGAAWGKYRSEMVTKFTRYTIRVHPDVKVSTYSATSAAIHGGGSAEAPDVRSAVISILLQRQRDQIAPPGR